MGKKNKTKQNEGKKQLADGDNINNNKEVKNVERPASSKAKSLAEQLELLGNLHKSGALTEDEFAVAKKAAIASELNGTLSEQGSNISDTKKKKKELASSLQAKNGNVRRSTRSESSNNKNNEKPLVYILLTVAVAGLGILLANSARKTSTSSTQDKSNTEQQMHSEVPPDIPTLLSTHNQTLLSTAYNGDLSFGDKIKKVNLDYVMRQYRTAIAKKKENQKTSSETPSPIDSSYIHHAHNHSDDEYWSHGLAQVVAGKVAVVTLAGGQGSRLGHIGPKGTFSFGPSQASLFQRFAERILRVQDLSNMYGLEQGLKFQKGGSRVSWVIMTSNTNHAETVDYFKSKSYFGLETEQVTFITQKELPAFTSDGQLFLSDKDTIKTVAAGNGEVYHALLSSGVLDNLTQMGTKWLHVHSVDNALTRVADPTFIGYTAKNDLSLALKGVIRNSASESAGVFVKPSGRHGISVFEYSEFNSEDVALNAFNIVNICNFVFKVDFIRDAADHSKELPYHVASKNMQQYDVSSKTTTKLPGKILEKFIHDAFPLAGNKFGVFVVKRELEFAPIKNAKGEDSPKSAMNLISRAHKKMLQSADVDVSTVVASANAILEISPLVTYKGEGLAESCSRGARGLNVSATIQRTDMTFPHFYLGPEYGFGMPLNINDIHVSSEGKEGSLGFKILHSVKDKRISPWHNIPLLAFIDNEGLPVFNFVCEIPKGSVRKYEIHKSKYYNPVSQDVSCGRTGCYGREYHYPESNPQSLVNYGAIPQTWEDPDLVREDTKEGGDNDPIDVLQIDDTPCDVGEVMSVRVLGAFAMVDNTKGTDRGETDWKLIVSRVDTPYSSPSYGSLEAVAASKISSLHEWFQNYKLPEGKSKNAFAFDGKPVNASYAIDVIMETHDSWKKFRSGRRSCSWMTYRLLSRGRRVKSSFVQESQACWRG
eukprot:m.41724 g.41724  ORF g.41724 m.41724 type:complete len:936 (+) comp9804_c0_seq2:256-3063(+)